jgi:hypothetical protein
LNALHEASQKIKARNVRAIAETAWTLEVVPGIEHLMTYEARLNYFVSGKPWVAICLYNVSKISGKVLMNVLQTHPYMISGGVIVENPYYQDPADWLMENAPEFLIKPA